MPYINKGIRASLEHRTAINAGELNYKFTKVALEYVKNNGISYKVLNDVLGAFEGAKLEFYRRKVAPYENVKMAENGDVEV